MHMLTFPNSGEVLLKIGEVEVIDNYMEKASAFRRIVAYLIDWTIALLFVVLGAILIIVIENFTQVNDATGNVIVAILICPYLLLKDLIFNGASVGKRLMSIEIVKKQTYDKPRKIIIVLYTIFSLDIITNAVMYFSSKESLGEMITNTSVVMSRKRRGDSRGSGRQGTKTY